MKSNGYLFDTNTISYMLEDELPAKAKKLVINEIVSGLKISVIVEIELLSWKCSEKTKRIVNNLISGGDIFGLTKPIIKQTANLRLNHKTKLPDAIIAATAIVNDLILITRNTKDFSKIDDLKILNPFEL